MGKSVHNDVLDAALSYISTNADRESVCETEPTTYAEATTNKGGGGKKLAMSSSPSFTGPADGDANGRKITVDQKTGITVDVTGDADHVALSDSINSKLLLVTTCTLQTLTSGNTVTIPAWDDEIADPT